MVGEENSRGENLNECGNYLKEVLGQKSLSHMSLPHMSLPHMSLSHLFLLPLVPKDKKRPTCPYGHMSLWTLVPTVNKVGHMSLHPYVPTISK